ncbi:MAG: hypothetical protein WD013_01245 [Gemmatimonadota bacterium]
MWWLVIIVFGLLIPEILSTILDSRLGRAMAAHIENRGSGGDRDGLVERIRYLESELDRLSGDVERLNEETEFFQKLLSERASRAEPGPAPGDRTS